MQYTSPPFGPRFSSFTTVSNEISSVMSIAGVYGSLGKTDAPQEPVSQPFYCNSAMKTTTMRDSRYY